MNYFAEFVTDGCALVWPPDCAGRNCTGLPLFAVREQERFAVLCLAICGPTLPAAGIRSSCRN